METSHIDLNLDAKLGAMFLGNVVAAILYGVTSVQTFIYFKGSAQDLRSLKVIVLILWLLDSLHIILVTHTVYFYTVSNYADPLALNTPICIFFAVSFDFTTIRLCLRYRLRLRLSDRPINRFTDFDYPILTYRRRHEFDRFDFTAIHCFSTVSQGTHHHPRTTTHHHHHHHSPRSREDTAHCKEPNANINSSFESWGFRFAAERWLLGR
ncbi:hypothetical protein ONZ45_g6484 [Pleurotus djamor]|nr:hypothetical protein ONZ45_g6484 [Pleurotus djamor]